MKENKLSIVDQFDHYIEENQLLLKKFNKQNNTKNAKTLSSILFIFDKLKPLIAEFQKCGFEQADYRSSAFMSFNKEMTGYYMIVQIFQGFENEKPYLYVDFSAQGTKIENQHSEWNVNYSDLILLDTKSDKIEEIMKKLPTPNIKPEKEALTGCTVEPVNRIFE